MAIAASDLLRRQGDVGEPLVDAAAAASAHQIEDGDEHDGSTACAHAGARVSAASALAVRAVTLR